MSYDEREVQAQMLEQLAHDVEGQVFEDFCLQHLSGDVGHREAFSEWLKFKAYYIRNPEPRRRRGDRPAAPRNLPEEEQPVWPPNPFYRVDEYGRFVYTDYDGESLVVWAGKSADGGLWIDKGGQGPVYVRAEDRKVIVDAIESHGL